MFRRTSCSAQAPGCWARAPVPRPSGGLPPATAPSRSMAATCWRWHAARVAGADPGRGARGPRRGRRGHHDRSGQGHPDRGSRRGALAAAGPVQQQADCDGPGPARRTAALDALPPGLRDALLAAAPQAQARGWAASRVAARESVDELRRHGVKGEQVPLALALRLQRLGERFALEWIREVGPQANAISIPYYSTNVTNATNKP